MLGSPRHEFSPLLVAPLLVAALLALTIFAPGAARAASPDSPLTPELAELATPAVAGKSAEAQAEAIGLPAEGAGSLAREGERVIVEAHFEAGAPARLEALEAAGAKVLFASRRYQTVTLSVEAADLRMLAEVPGLSAVEPSRRPVVYGAESGPVDTTSTAARVSNERCEGGSVISQGLEQLNVPAARAAFGARGAGETVGVISDSFDSATTSVEGRKLAANAHDDEVSNDLPGPASTCSGQQLPVNVIEEAPAPAAGEEGLTDEGRAMLQVVHDLAPQAGLAFATAFVSELGFARNIERLAEPVADGGAGANVIVDDIGYFTEPFFQEGPVAVAIQKVTEAGVVYLTAAGNDNLFAGSTGHEIASWERSEFDDTACPTGFQSIVHEGASSCMNFSPTGTDATFGITVEKERELIVDLQWAEPWHGVESDLNAYLLNEAGTALLYDHPIDNITEGAEGEGEEAFPAPTELLGWENKSDKAVKVQLVIDRCIHNCNPTANPTTEPRLKFELLEDGRGVSATEYPESDAEAGIIVGPTIYGHAGSAAAITLGAVKYTESATQPKEPERYSSRGPVTHYFGPVDGITPAAELTTPELIEKPNLTATDCASTTFFAELEAGSYHFCGTSEAGPHAAAVAALMQQTDPLASSKAVVEAMEESATPFTTVTSPQAVGAGLLNADAALTALGGSPVEDPPSTVVAALEEEPESETTPQEEAKEETTTSTPKPTPVPTPAPTVTITKGPASLSNESRPTFEFTSSRPAGFTCQIDGGTAQPCASPYLVPSALADGAHGFAVTATDSGGLNAGSAAYDFTVDTKAPRPKVAGHPAKIVRTAKSSYLAHFRLASGETGVTYYCQFDGEALRICGQRFTHRFTSGHHVLKVKAEDALGNLTVSPTVFNFRVKKISR